LPVISAGSLRSLLESGDDAAPVVAEIDVEANQSSRPLD
jgi:hypothetical protein